MPSSTPATLNPTVAEVTQRIRERSAERRALYEQRMADQHKRGVHRAELSCGNLAHGFAACSPQEKDSLKLMNSANLGIISSYNDMLSAHQPFETFRKPSKPLLAPWAQPPSLPVVFLPCVMGLPKGNRAWNCRCFPAT